MARSKRKPLAEMSSNRAVATKVGSRESSWWKGSVLILNRRRQLNLRKLDLVKRPLQSDQSQGHINFTYFCAFLSLFEVRFGV